jgi:putative ABC transport system substrate-binding protein
MLEILRSRFVDSRKSKIQNRKWAGLFAIVVALTVCGARAEAQQPAKAHRIGFQSAASPSAISARTEAFRDGLRELGYVEGKNIVIEWRFAEGKLARLDEFAAEFVRLKVDAIVTAAPSSTRAAKKATSTIPIVMAYDSNPVANGFVASLARPGTNITGLSSLAPEISGKQLELLKEIIPKLSRVGVLGTSSFSRSYELMSKEMQPAARTLGVQLQYFDVLGPDDIETAFRSARKARAAAILVLASPILESDRTQVADVAAKSRLPAIYHVPEFVEVGGLISYGVSFIDLYRRAATYVDKILRGAKPADLPVEQPTKFELVINLRTAKQIGLTIPPNVLARAAKVIK